MDEFRRSFPSQSIYFCNYIIIPFFGKIKKTYRASGKPFYSGVSLRGAILSNRTAVIKKTESFPFRNIATLLIIF